MGASVVVAHRLSCPARCGIVPGAMDRTVSPALAGRFLTTRSPGKSRDTGILGGLGQACLLQKAMKLEEQGSQIGLVQMTALCLEALCPG